MQRERLPGMSYEMQCQGHQWSHGAQGMAGHDVALHHIAQQFAQHHGTLLGADLQGPGKAPAPQKLRKLICTGRCFSYQPKRVPHKEHQSQTTTPQPNRPGDRALLVPYLPSGDFAGAALAFTAQMLW